MKSVIKVAGMVNSNDVRRVQEAVASNAGVIASEINLEKKEAIIIYNDSYLDIDNVIDSIEDLGYTVI